MTIETMFVDLVLRNWKQGTDRVDKFFGGQTEEELQREIAPGKNRLIYLWGHLAAVNDALRPLLGFGALLHPELEGLFIKNPDRAIEPLPSAIEVRHCWTEINASLWTHFQALTPSQWLEKHNAVSADDFVKEPHRNRCNVVLNRLGHTAEHLGQALLVETRR